MSTTGNGTTTAQRRFSGHALRKALDHASNSWFPPNEELLQKIKNGLKSGVYEANFELLITEVSTDLSLFSYCLRELGAMAEEARTEEIPAGPVTILRRAGLSKLRQLLEVDAKKICPDSLNAISGLQLSRLQEFMVSVSTSAVLSERYALDEELAVGAALVRQLGYTLIAWAYPAEYERAMGQCSDSISIDMSLTQLFGFSPMLLGFRTARRWNLLPEIYRATDSDGEVLPPGDRSAEEIERIAGQLVQITKIGEALARANNPGCYPTAQADFDQARCAIEEKLGADGLAVIRNRLTSWCSSYVELMPHIFRGAFELDPVARLAGQRQQLLAGVELFAKCRPFLRKKLERLVPLVRPGGASKDLLQILARDVIPSAGFLRGVVYMLEPGSMSLVPQLAIGNATMVDFKAVPYEPRSAKASFVAEAFQAAVPLVQPFTSSRGGRVMSLAAGLGTSTKVGVLYLEMGTEIFDGDEEQQLAHFLAIINILGAGLGVL